MQLLIAQVVLRPTAFKRNGSKVKPQLKMVTRLGWDPKKAILFNFSKNTVLTMLS